MDGVPDPVTVSDVWVRGRRKILPMELLESESLLDLFLAGQRVPQSADDIAQLYGSSARLAFSVLDSRPPLRLVEDGVVDVGDIPGVRELFEFSQDVRWVGLCRKPAAKVRRLMPHVLWRTCRVPRPKEGSVLVRFPPGIREMVGDRADRAGVSRNEWIVRVVCERLGVPVTGLLGPYDDDDDGS